jgi:hypothetical protein
MSLDGLCGDPTGDCTSTISDSAEVVAIVAVMRDPAQLHRVGGSSTPCTAQLGPDHGGPTLTKVFPHPGLQTKGEKDREWQVVGEGERSAMDDELVAGCCHLVRVSGTLFTCSRIHLNIPMELRSEEETGAIRCLSSSQVSRERGSDVAASQLLVCSSPPPPPSAGSLIGDRVSSSVRLSLAAGQPFSALRARNCLPTPRAQER